MSAISATEYRFLLEYLNYSDSQGTGGSSQDQPGATGKKEDSR